MATKKVLTGLAPQPADQFTPFEPHEMHAIKALLNGKATESQQLMFVKWFVRASGVNENPFRPGGDEGRRATDFAAGKKFVGDQFFSIAKTTVPDPRQG